VTTCLLAFAIAFFIFDGFPKLSVVMLDESLAAGIPEASWWKSVLDVVMKNSVGVLVKLLYVFSGITLRV